jgi:hypothetical protein
MTVMFGPQEYEQRWLHSNQSVQVGMLGGEADGQNGEERMAVIKGLSASGFRPSLTPTAIS